MATLEIKYSTLEGRYKKTDSCKFRSEKDILKKHYIDEIYGSLYPSFKITYDRFYYEFNGFRITVDQDIEYHNPRSKNQPTIKEHESVMEVKTTYEMPRDLIEKYLPFQTSRFSKYSRAALSFGF